MTNDNLRKQLDLRRHKGIRMNGRKPDDPRYPYDYTEWWMCDNCKRQWYVPEDYEERLNECPGCGHEEHTLRDTQEPDGENNA